MYTKVPECTKSECRIDLRPWSLDAKGAKPALLDFQGNCLLLYVPNECLWVKRLSISLKDWISRTLNTDKNHKNCKHGDVMQVCELGTVIPFWGKSTLPVCRTKLELFLPFFSGIFAYLNHLTPKSRREILELLVGGLKRLEYRGYDSAGKVFFDMKTSFAELLNVKVFSKKRYDHFKVAGGQCSLATLRPWLFQIHVPWPL